MENGATLYSGGRVLVLDGVTPPQEALVVRDGRVAGVGDAGDMTRLAGQGARCVSVRGATIMPGLIDTHPHLLHFGAFTEPLVDLSDARDHDEIVARIRRRAAETPAGEWIMTTPVGEPHYFLRRSWRHLAEGALPDRHVLDRATREHPVFIQAWAPVIPNPARSKRPDVHAAVHSAGGPGGPVAVPSGMIVANRPTGGRRLGAASPQGHGPPARSAELRTSLSIPAPPPLSGPAARDAAHPRGH